MKPIYKSLALAAMTLQVSVALQAQVNDGTATSQIDVPAEVLDSLRVELIAPNVSGARDLVKSGECTVSDNALSIELQTGEWLKGGVYRLNVIATFGTQTMVIYALDVTVPRYDALASDPQEYEDTVIVVSTYGDGAGSQITVDPTPTEGSENPVASGGVYTALAGKQPAGSYADGSIYKVGDSGSPAVHNVAKVHANSVELSENAQATGGKAVAEGSNTKATGNSAHAMGETTTASGAQSFAGGIGDYGGKVEASGQASFAFGKAVDDYGRITAGGNGAMAVGKAESSMFANGEGSQAFGVDTQTQTSGQMVIGKYNILDTNGDYAFIVGNGTGSDSRSNAFAIDWNGNLVLFNAGTPVVLTPAKLAQLIA